MSVYNTLPAAIYIIDRIFPGGRPPVGLLQLGAASVTLVTAAVLVLTQVGLDFSDSAYFWLVVGVICSATYTHVLLGSYQDIAQFILSGASFSRSSNLLALRPHGRNLCGDCKQCKP